MATFTKTIVVPGRLGQGDRTLRLDVQGTDIQLRVDGFCTHLTPQESAQLANAFDGASTVATSNRTTVGL